jgi:hypothetical protein
MPVGDVANCRLKAWRTSLFKRQVLISIAGRAGFTAAGTSAGAPAWPSPESALQRLEAADLTTLESWGLRFLETPSLTAPRGIHLSTNFTGILSQTATG